MPVLISMSSIIFVRSAELSRESPRDYEIKRIVSSETSKITRTKTLPRDYSLDDRSANDRYPFDIQIQKRGSRASFWRRKLSKLREDDMRYAYVFSSFNLREIIKRTIREL